MFELHANLRDAFRDMRAAGINARMDYACCGSCGAYELGKGGRPYAFYHHQDAADYNVSGETYIAFSAGAGQTVAKILTDRGLKVEWDGSDATRILVNTNKDGERHDLRAARARG